jgi:hypothetical protein
MRRRSESECQADVWNQRVMERDAPAREPRHGRCPTLVRVFARGGLS